MDTTMCLILSVNELTTVISQLTPIFLFYILIQAILTFKEKFILTIDKMFIIAFSCQRGLLLGSHI